LASTSSCTARCQLVELVNGGGEILIRCTFRLLSGLFSYASRRCRARFGYEIVSAEGSEELLYCCIIPASLLYLKGSRLLWNIFSYQNSFRHSLLLLVLSLTLDAGRRNNPFLRLPSSYIPIYTQKAFSLHVSILVSLVNTALSHGAGEETRSVSTADFKLSFSTSSIVRDVLAAFSPSVSFYVGYTSADSDGAIMMTGSEAKAPFEMSVEGMGNATNVTADTRFMVRMYLILRC